MTTHEQNGYLILAHLSDIELYYSPPQFIEIDDIIVNDEEFHHAVKVMRNTVGDILHITDGLGTIYKTRIVEIKKDRLSANIDEKYEYKNPAENIWFCIPLLKNQDRLKFAFEKCVELGITNFILFSSKHTISKKANVEKYQKTLLAAMKQSLRAFLPNIIAASFDDILKFDGTKILLDQNSEKKFDSNIRYVKPTYFLFGPEGGFDQSEINSVSAEKRFSLSTHRLRSETAIIKCASLMDLL